MEKKEYWEKQVEKKNKGLIKGKRKGKAVISFI